MDDTVEHQDRYAAGLARLFDLGLELAEHLHARALAAEDPQAVTALAQTFHTVGRSLRQTAALAGKLQADQLRLDGEAAVNALKQRQRAVEERKDQIRAPLHRLIWNEAEPADYEELISDAEGWIAAVADTHCLFRETVEAHVQRICREMDLSLGTLPSAAIPPAARDAMAVIATLRQRGPPSDARRPSG